MAFNGFPYVNFSDLNLDWLLTRIQDVLTLVNSANNKSDDAIELATEANERTLTYSQQIADATADAEEALELAQNSQDILVIYPDNEGKPVNYKKYMNGETEYIGTDEILTELTLHKRIPFFMDRNQNVFILNGVLDSGTSNTKVRFSRMSGSSTFLAIIDRNQTITYNSAEDGSLYNVSFNYSNGGWSSDKTFSQILSAINSGKTISLTIKYNGEIRDVVTGSHLTSTSPTVIYFGYTKGVSEVSPMDANTNAFAYFTINSSEVVTQQAVKYVPNSSTQISGYVLTVNSNGIPEWLPASGGGGSTDVLIINATYSNGEYTFDKNQSEILSAIQNGMLPVVRYHTTTGQSNYHVYYEWVFDYYTYDGEEVYIYFSRVDQSGNSAQLRWFGSTAKATEYSRPTLPPATGADDGKIPMVNSFGYYQLVSIPAAENTSFGT